MSVRACETFGQAMDWKFCSKGAPAGPSILPFLDHSGLAH